MAAPRVLESILLYIIAADMMTRNRRLLPVLLLLPPLLLAVWAVLIEPRLFVVRDWTIESADWPAARVPIRIAVIADLHVGSPGVDLDRVDDIVAAVNAAQPDLIVLLGDFVIDGVPGGHVVPPESIAAALAGLEAPLGTFAVLGNHDWWNDAARLNRAFFANGIPVLENSVEVLQTSAGPLALAGIGDDSTGHADVDRTFRQLPPGMPAVVIAHDPSVFGDMPWAGVALTIAGHTHGGQVYLPFIGALIVPGRAPRRWAYGHIVEFGRHLFVSGGVGTSILPIRFNMPPGVEIVTLGAVANKNEP